MALTISRTHCRDNRVTSASACGYTYNGSQLTQMTVVADTLTFTYDASSNPQTVTYGGTTYYYVTNLQGDVIAILNSAGTKVVSYTYDAWGNSISGANSTTSTLGTLNPLRYRGYVYDHETGLYYLQSCYYNPKLGRFINTDALVSTGRDCWAIICLPIAITTRYVIQIHKEQLLQRP